ncbi:Fic family protein [Fibrella sp. HMF5335]|uniref:Fic family protein n=1 Tax=Fibrella rubiginis TaxID=2817060 RepID=A0A939K0I8_9BACT|nr:Fic family protein [Fibrella rubiginis]MBO0936142.1 Fic family protein [Fibrella rubiginis]
MAYHREEPYNDLPDLPPAINFYQPEIVRALAAATRYLGELNGLCATLPDPLLLLNTLVLQESRDSSAIENIVTTQDELYRASVDGVPTNTAAKEVLSYREATYTGIARMRTRHNLILTNTLIEVVQTIKNNQSAIRQTPGTTLRSSGSGDVMYTPPTGETVIRQKMAALEQFINEDSEDGPDTLIKLALMHYQFEAIHPFSDGNGRTGRIMINLYLVQQQRLSQPILYLSRYINIYRSTYYKLLRSVTEDENWTEWIIFMLNAIADTSRLTMSKIRRILVLMGEVKKEMAHTMQTSHNPELLRLMFAQPYLKVDFLVKSGLVHRQTASTYLKKLAAAGILTPNPVGRTTYYVNQRLIDLLAD